MKKEYYTWHKSEIGYLDIIEPFINNSVILDAGCGTGWIGKILKEYNKNIRVIGLDNDMQGLAQSQLFENPVLCNINKIPFRDSTFEGIIAKDVIEHLTEPLLTMNEFHRILKSNGKIFVSTPDVKCKIFYDDYSHIRPYNRKSLTRLAEDAGFFIEDIWYSSNWPGLGRFMNIFKINRTPKIIRSINALGINRQNICLLARKN
jgi:ubiquinone/menaquinone biosynthesis C-methylase UbiE